MKINILIVFLSFNLVLNLHGSEGEGEFATKKADGHWRTRLKFSQSSQYISNAPLGEISTTNVHDNNVELGQILSIKVAQKMALLLSAKNLSMLNRLALDVIKEHGQIMKLPFASKSVVLDEKVVTGAARKKFPYELAKKSSGKNDVSKLSCTACGESFANRTQTMLNHPCGKGSMLREIAENKQYAVVVMRSLLSDIKQTQEQEKSKTGGPACPEGFDMFAFKVRFSCAAKGERFVSNTMPARSFHYPAAIIDAGIVSGVGPVAKKPGRGTGQAGAGQAVAKRGGK